MVLILDTLTFWLVSFCTLILDAHSHTSCFHSVRVFAKGISHSTALELLKLIKKF